MKPKKVLVVDDDTLMRRSVGLLLEQNGIEAFTAGSAEDGIEMVKLNSFDLILLDIGLPGMDGLESLRYFQQLSRAPILFISARRRELDTILALEMGGDAYVTKPFNPDYLLAHLKALLRRTEMTEREPRSEVITLGDLKIDPGSRCVFLGDREIQLNAKEFDLLHALAIDAENVVPIDDLIHRVWGAEFDGEPQVVYVYIRWLREKVEKDPNSPDRIITVRGVGYRLVDPERG